MKSHTRVRLTRWGTFLASLTLIAAASTVTAAPAAADAGLAEIKNGGSRTLTICRNAASSTACSGPTGTLGNGQNSRTKYNWSDTDMVQIPARCSLQQYTWYQSAQMWMPFAGATTSTRWFKVSGSPVLPYRYTFRIVC